MHDKFYIVKLIKELTNDFDKYLDNFPNREIEIKRKIMDTSYDMLMIAYEGNTTYNIDKRIDIIEKIISYIKYLDYLVNVCYDKKIINSKRYLRFGNSLDYLLKYVLSWYKVSREIKDRA